MKTNCFRSDIVLSIDFKEIVGQKRIKSWMQHVIKNDEMGHAYAFSADEGMGKMTIANVFSKMLLCTHLQQANEAYDSQELIEACGKCRSCKTFDSGANPDFYYLKKEKMSIGVDDIRRLQHSVSISPMYSRRKVYIIPEAELLTGQAQNALLKTIEEPPVEIVILMLTKNYEAFLETIQSRVVKKELEKYSKEDIEKYIESRYNGEANLEFIVKIADGNIGFARKLIEEEEFILLRERVFNVIMDLVERKSESNLTLLSLLEEQKENYKYVFSLMKMIFRDLLIISDKNLENILINIDKKDAMKDKRNFFVKDNIIRWIDILQKVEDGLYKNANYSLSMEYLTMELAL